MPHPLTDAFCEAYPIHVMARLEAGGITPPPGMPAAVREGTEWLFGQLERLLSMPFDSQRRSPLELYQEAMRFPTEALSASGVEPVDRDRVTAAALPGDVYDLAPASSQELGEAAWEAHLAWGAAKARYLTRPVVGYVGRGLLDASKLEPVIEDTGFRLGRFPHLPDHFDSVVALLVDLEHPDADEAIRLGAESQVKVIAFGPHVDDVALVRARSLGATDALARSRFFATLPDLLPRLV